MITRFAIGVSDMSSEEDGKLRDYLKENGYGWWHWIENLWLVIDTSGKLTAGDLFDALRGIAPEKWNIVLEIEQVKDWAGYGPAGKKQNMFNWFEDTSDHSDESSDTTTEF